MNVDDFRDFCLSLKGAQDKMPWSDKDYSSLMIFEVGDKWFGMVDIDSFEYCNLKCDPEKSLELRERYQGIKPAWHMNKKHWISVYFNSDVPDSMIKELIEHSYSLVFNKLTRKVKEAINS